MYQIGTVVNHPTAGVCKIDDIRDKKFQDLAKRTYYILHPVSGNKSTVYVPVDTQKVHLRKMMTRDEIIDLIGSTDVSIISWNEKANLRKAEYIELLRSDDIRNIIALIAFLHTKKDEYLQLDKKFPTTEERILKEAENKIHQEFSYALNMPPEQVPLFIMENLHMPAKQHA